MKKFLAGILIVSGFSMCKQSLETDKNLVQTIDSTRLYSNADTAIILPNYALNTYPAPVAKQSTATVRKRSRTTSNRSGSGTATSTTQTAKKKGWSHAAKGAVIGGVGGAVVGATVSKNHGKGAIIGGVVGAAGGYIIGRSKDKKENQ